MAGTLFYCPNILESPVLPEEESYHCVKVLRTQEGEIINVTDGKGSFYHCELVQAHPKQCIVAIRQQSKAVLNRSFSLHIAFAPTKQMDRNEWFLEKGTEIGINRFTPPPLPLFRAERDKGRATSKNRGFCHEAINAGLPARGRNDGFF